MRKELITNPAPRVEPDFGLFSVVTEPNPGTSFWQGEGVNWEQPSLAALGGVGKISEATGQVGLPKTLTATCTDTATAEPFVLYGHFTGSPITYFDEAQGLAEANLLAFEEMEAEKELWLGALGSVPNFNAANSYDALEDLGTTGDVNEAVGLAETHLLNTHGGVGVLHISRKLIYKFIKSKAVEVVNGTLQTAMGTPVAAGAGYGDDKIVITPPVFLFRSEIITSSSTSGDLLDRKQNDLYAVAERTYLIGFDPTGAAAVTLDFTPAAP